MNNWDDYKPEAGANSGTGKHRCVVVAAEEAVSKTSGNPMFIITVTPNGSKAKVKAYIVKNDKFNQKMTTFFDSFGITRGNFNVLEWIGAIGAADFDTDENGYLKVKWFLTGKQVESLPEWEGEVPERQTVSSLADNEDTPFDDDDLPL